MNNIVCCYFSELINNEFSIESKQLIPIWEKSWQDKGWQTLVLNESHAKSNELYDEKIFTLECNFFKSHKHVSEYLKTCYQRWFAYSTIANQHDQIHWADYDVINYNYFPHDYMPVNVIFDPSYCCGKIDKDMFVRILQSFINNAYIDDDHYSSYNLTDNNDMCLLDHMRMLPLRRICSDPCGGLPAPNNAKLVHFHGGIKYRMPELKLNDKTRIEIIKEIRPYE